MDKPDSIRCENCIFGYGKTPYLRCHRYPPILLDNSDEYSQPRHPNVSPLDWCAEFGPKDNLTAVEWVAYKKGLIEDAKV